MMAFRSSSRQGGQAAVETAIVLPLHLFLLLGILQWGLIAHARSLAKYAAYRAVRVGAMQHADPDKMKQAAILALLTIIAQPNSGFTGGENILPTRNATEVVSKLGRVWAMNALAKGTLGRPIVNVVVCGPLRQDVAGSAQTAVGSGVGDAREVDFDDPRVATEGFDGSGNANSGDPNYGNFIRTKLRIQVQFLYRMPIPFANWILSYAYLGMQLPEIMRMGTAKGALVTRSALKGQKRALFDAMLLANQARIYFAPINVNYSMRMQSDFYLAGKTDLPRQNNCFHYLPAGG